MAKKLESNIQAELSYTYISAQARMSAHKEYAEEQKKILDNHGYLTEEEAVLKVKSYDKKPFKCQVWASIEKDEEFYCYGGKWIVSDNYDILLAAEYLGFAQVPIHIIIGR